MSETATKNEGIWQHLENRVDCLSDYFTVSEMVALREVIARLKELSPIDTNCQQDEMVVDKLYTIEEAAELLKMSPRGIRDWIQKKKLKAFKLPDGKKWIIHEDDIQGMIDKGRKGGD